LFVAMVVWAPGGLSGILLAHAPIFRARQGGRLAARYAAMLPGAVAMLLGIVALCETAFRLQAVRGGAPAIGQRVLGLPADPTTVLPWIVGIVLILVGFLALRPASRSARGAWMEAAAAAAA